MRTHIVHRRSHSLSRRIVLVAAFAALLAAAPAHALRVVTWNLLGYDELAANARRAHTLAILPTLNPDVIVIQELLTAAAADSFAAYLKLALPGKVWKGGSSTTYLAPTQSALYYDSLQVAHSNLVAVNTGGPRQVLVALLRPNGYKANAASFRLYSIHFKAGKGDVTPTDSSTRTLECTNLRNNLNLAPAGTNILLGGDTNFYGSYETGYTRLTESQADNDGRLKDPYSMPGVWNQAGYAPFHTQSPCNGSPCVGSSGGMDDRFDVIFGTYGLSDGNGLDLVSGALPSGYGAYGNDGLHFNDSIDGGGVNTAVGLVVAAALRQASDHLPVVATLQLPAKLACEHALDFGDVIVGAVAARTLTVDDLPPVPAATLSYSLTAPAGFSAPGGGFTNAASALPALHNIGMSTVSVGPKSGTLTVNSNDLDTTAKAVLLTGRVLAHAVPSLDSLVSSNARSLDFGEVATNSVTELDLRVFNRGYSALQARLAHSGAFVAGSTRFSFTPPAGLIGAGGTFAVSFDSNGATPGTDFNAELRIPAADEPIPGAAFLDTLRIALHARTPANGGVEGAPTALRFAPPAPNPLHRGTTFAFELPSEQDVSLQVFDAGGRLVGTVAAGRWPAGRWSRTWQAADASGAPLRAGLYFARFRAGAFTRVARLVLLP